MKKLLFLVTLLMMTAYAVNGQRIKPGVKDLPKADATKADVPLNAGDSITVDVYFLRALLEETKKVSEAGLPNFRYQDKYNDERYVAVVRGTVVDQEWVKTNWVLDQATIFLKIRPPVLVNSFRAPREAYETPTPKDLEDR